MVSRRQKFAVPQGAGCPHGDSDEAPPARFVRRGTTSGAGLQSGFLSEERLADLLFRRHAVRAAAGVLRQGELRFRLLEAVRIVGCAHGDDPYGLVGTVETPSELKRAGAAAHGDALWLGRATYRIERGVLLRPLADDEY